MLHLLLPHFRATTSGGRRLTSNGMRIVRPVPCGLSDRESGSDSGSDSMSDSEPEDRSVRSLSQPGIALTPRSSVIPSLLLLLGEDEEEGGRLRSSSSSTSDISLSIAVTSFSSIVVVMSELVLGRREVADMCRFQAPSIHAMQRSVLLYDGNMALHSAIRHRRFT